MRKLALTVILSVLSWTIAIQAGNYRADFYRAHQGAVAMRLLNRSKKYKEAQAAFAKLAETAKTPEGKAKWTAWAAIAMSRRKGESEAAMALAKSAGDGPHAKYARMVIMGQERKWKELVEVFNDEHLAAWPDDIRQQALLLRGRALTSVDNQVAAIQDYERVLAERNPKKYDWVRVMSAIIHCRDQLGDDAGTLAAYRRMFDMSEQINAGWIGSSYHGRAMIGAAKILERQGKLNEALAILTKHDVGSKSVGGAAREATGDLLVKMGKTKAAIVKYEEAIMFNDKIAKRHQRRNPAIKKKIEALRKPAAETK